MRTLFSRFNLLTPFHPPALRNNTNKVPSTAGGGLGWGLTTLALAMLLVLLPSNAAGQTMLQRYQGDKAFGQANHGSQDTDEGGFIGSANYVAVRSHENNTTNFTEGLSVTAGVSISKPPSIDTSVTYSASWGIDTVDDWFGLASWDTMFGDLGAAVTGWETALFSASWEDGTSTDWLAYGQTWTLSNGLVVAFGANGLSVTPEPTTLAVLGLGLAGLGWARRRKAA